MLMQIPLLVSGVAGTAARMVAHKPHFGVSDYPICGARVGFAEIFLMPQPPLLTRRGLMRNRIENAMLRLFMVLLVFTANAVLFAAGSSDLLVAIRNGDHSRVQKLLGAGADVNAVDSDGTTTLMHSVIES